jgi:hypothetical protein
MYGFPGPPPRIGSSLHCPVAKRRDADRSSAHRGQVGRVPERTRDAPGRRRSGSPPAAETSHALDGPETSIPVKPDGGGESSGAPGRQLAMNP